MSVLPRVLMITSEWPTENEPYIAPFVVRQVKFLRKHGVDIDVFPFRGNKALLNYWKARREVSIMQKINTYDLIHAQWGQSALLVFPTKKPLVISFRGDDLLGIIGEDGRKSIQGFVLQSLSKFFARIADEVILVSKAMARYIGSRTYHVIPSGLDLELFKPQPKMEARRKLGLRDECFIVLFVGNISNPRKRYSLAKEAVKKAKKQIEIELLTAANVNHSEIPVYMNAADLLLLVSAHEGSPNVIKEALACNLPVLSTDVGDVRERIDGIPGCKLIEKVTVGGIANELVEQHRIHIQRKMIGNCFSSREHVLNLNEDLLAERVIDIYKNALNKKKKSGTGEK